MMGRAAVLLLAVLLAAGVSATRRQLSVRTDRQGQLELVEGWVDGALVTSDFNNTINSTGSASLLAVHSSDCVTAG